MVILDVTLEELLEKIADLQEKVSNLSVGIAFVLCLILLSFVGLAFLIYYLNNTFRLCDSNFRLFDSLPSRYRRKLMRSYDRHNKECVNDFCDSMEAHNVE